MKHFKLMSVLLLLTLAGRAQTPSGPDNPCPDIQSATTVLVSSVGTTCTAKVVIRATGDVGGDKGLGIKVFLGPNVNGTLLRSSCFIVPGPSPSTAYTTANFSYPCGSEITYQITRYTASNGNCQGGTCGEIITVTGPDGGTLPIKLSSFYGNRKSNAVHLSWTTDQESNASHFEIERNTGSGFVSINNVSATNTSIQTQYSFEDVNASKSAAQYRLKLVDKDGSFALSNVVSIKAISSVSNVDIYPNPAVVGNAKIKISDITDITNIQVYDLTGKILKNISVTNNDINMSDLQAGSYLLKMINAKTGGSASKRFIILN